MRWIAFIALAVLMGGSWRLAHGQELRQAEMASVRRALAIDPFAVAPYRLLTANLRANERRALVGELAKSSTFADRVVAARMEIDGGQVASARELLHLAAPIALSDSRTLDAFCQLAMSAGAFADAALTSRRALEHGRNPQRLVVAAITELQQGRRKEGLELLAEARKKDPVGGAAESAIDALLGQRMTAEAAELLRAELAPGTGRPSGASGSATQWRRLADLERQLGRTAESSDALMHALDVETSPTGRRALAQAVMRLYRDKKHLPELVRGLKSAATAPRLVLRGDVETELGHGSAAIASYEAAARLDPLDPDPPLRLATAAKTPAERAARYATLVAAHPAELRFALELADLRFLAKDDSGGKRALAEAASRFSSAPAAQEQIARRYVDHGDAAGALACRRRTAELDSRNPEYALVLGDAYRALGKRTEAVAAYLDSIKRAGDSRAGWDRAVEALERAGYNEEAGARYKEMRARWPADSGIARRYAAVLERDKAFAEALAIWKDIGKKTLRPFEKEQADYNVNRLEQIVMGRGK